MTTELTPPPLACDCHVHVYDAAYPLAPTATFVPPDAPVQRLMAMHNALGIERAVIVQPTGYGFDNRCTMAAVAALGQRGRAVVVVNADTTDAALQTLHDGGTRGVRFMMLAGGVLPWDALEPVAARIRALGWHINLQMNGCDLPQVQDRLARLPVPLVIDHLGKFLPPPAVDSAAFRSLCTLLDGGHAWVKLSAPYESSQTGAPAYADVGALAAVLAREYPDRCLWASNWPHPNRDPLPRDADLLGLLNAWAGDAATVRRILVDNPQTLYGF
ncbi:MAG: amidohydrolase family protein [Ramlibacter sp.]